MIYRAGSWNFANVRKTFQGAHSILTAACYMKNTLLRGNGTSFRGRDRWEKEEMSVLGSIMANVVTREMVNHRRLVEQIWQHGKLHELCGVRKGKEEVISVDDSSSPPPPEPRKQEREEEEGRYAIKRSRKKASPTIEVFTTDEEADWDTEEEEERIRKKRRVDRPPSVNGERNREYWLAKGPVDG